MLWSSRISYIWSSHLVYLARRKAQKERTKKNAKDQQGADLNFDDTELYSDTKGIYFVMFTFWQYKAATRLNMTGALHEYQGNVFHHKGDESID